MRQRLQGAFFEQLAKLWDHMPVNWRRRLIFAGNDHFIIGVVGLLTDDQGRVLLLEHRFRTPWRWGLPGGYVNRGESMNSALIRELLEEVGLAIETDPEPLDWEMNGRSGCLSVTLQGRVPHPPARLSIRSAEILGGGFFGPEDLPDGLYPYHRTLALRHFGQDSAQP